METSAQHVGAGLAGVVSTAIGVALGVGFTLGAVLIAGGMLLEKVAAF